jgi:hypothetical protein
MSRDNFKAPIKLKLAQRAGYICSICNSLTVGPSDESLTSVNLTGVAAHISGASSGRGSRRYDSNLSPEYRSSIENGIWLCQTDADLIDGDEKKYTTPYLKEIKKNHEKKITLKQSGINVEQGVITSIEITNIGIITSTVKMNFSERNIIKGNNGIGKTMICEFIASLANKKYLNRWTIKRTKTNSTFSIEYFKNSPERFTISIDAKGEVSYFYNDSPTPILTPPIRVFYIKISFYYFVQRNHEYTDSSLIEQLAGYYDLTKSEIINVLSITEKSRKFLINDLFLNEDKTSVLVRISNKLNAPTFDYNELSGGEQERVLLEITLKLADYYSKFTSTILIIDNTSIGSLDRGGINRLLEIIREEKINFQFFFTSIIRNTFNTEGFTKWVLDYSQDNIIVASKRE